MECSCKISIDHDGGPEFSKIKIQIARKEHICCECYRIINPGEKYEYVFGIWDSLSIYKTCIDCQSIRNIFFTDWIYTQLWDNFQDEFNYIDSIVPESCISELTPRARDRVCDFVELRWDN